MGFAMNFFPPLDNVYLIARLWLDLWNTRRRCSVSVSDTQSSQKDCTRGFEYSQGHSHKDTVFKNTQEKEGQSVGM